MKINLFDDGIGSIEYIQHMGTDLTVVNSARVSFGAEKDSLDDKDANPDSPAPRPHSCLTVDLVDKEGEPTMEAAKRVISFFQERLLATAR